ncbi:MAG TPA: hypothetical protein VM534_00670 [Thermoanaerobaculia bacterium]|nr:hypothetical protein [Thermoanaerobaculia bacterium]
MTRSNLRSMLFLVLVPALLFGAPGDVPLSTALPAPMRNIFGFDSASSGEDYLLVFRQGDDVYWQRLDLDGAAIDPRPRRIVLERSTLSNPQVVWTGRDYAIFLDDSEGVLRVRVSRAGTETIERFSLGPVVGAASSRGETTLLTAGPAPGVTLTRFDEQGNVLQQRSALRAGPSGLFRTDFGWRRLQPVFENDRLSGHGVFDAESEEAVIPLVGKGGFTDATPAPGGGLFLYATDSGASVVIDAAEQVRRVEGMPSHLDNPIVSGHRDGWTVLYRRSGAAWQANVGLDGTLIGIQQIVLPPERELASISEFASGSRSHHLLFTVKTFGIEVVEIDGPTLFVRADLGMADAAQTSAQIAEGPGVDLVVWRESTGEGSSVRATRVLNGMGLDGAGLLLGGGGTAVFDGEMFLVAWADASRRVWVRRLGIDGSLTEPAMVSERGTSSMSLASRGDGVALLTWTVGELQGISGSLIVHGIPGPVIPKIAGPHSPQSAFDGQNFLVTADQRFECPFICVSPPHEVVVKILNPDGTPSGPAVVISEGYGQRPGRPLPRNDGWLVPVLDNFGLTLVEITTNGFPYRELRMMKGELIETTEGTMLWSTRFRGVIDEQLRPEWFEALPVAPGEGNGGALADGSYALVQYGSRYFIRPAPAHPLRADLGVTIQRSRELGTRIERVRIEHRGGDVIPSIHVGVEGGVRREYPEVFSDRPVVDGAIAGPFAPGDSVELEVRWEDPAGMDLLIWALPEARDLHAADNFVTLPAVERRRAVRRGE